MIENTDGQTDRQAMSPRILKQRKEMLARFDGYVSFLSQLERIDNALFVECMHYIDWRSARPIVPNHYDERRFTRALRLVRDLDDACSRGMIDCRFWELAAGASLAFLLDTGHPILPAMKGLTRQEAWSLIEIFERLLRRLEKLSGE